MRISYKSVMKNLLFIFVCLSVAYTDACAIEEGTNVPQEIKGFILLLTEQRAPTLADFTAFYGPNAEDETQLLLKYCDSKGMSHDSCVQESNFESNAPTQHTSRYLFWIRNCYATVGHEWKILDMHPIKDKNTETGAIYDISLNDSIFKIQYVFPPYRYDGLVVAIYKINGKDTDELLKGGYPKCMQMGT